MQYALVNGQRTKAFPNGKGVCPQCNSTVIAKCGSRNIKHWAHHRTKDCDPWHENETPWHREWKSLFPSECQEVTHRANNGEIHRADIKTSTGVIVEIQHSHISDKERLSRELFYQNLVWVVDGRGFQDNFYIYHILPRPDSELAQDLVWMKAEKGCEGANRGFFFRLSDAIKDEPNITKATLSYGEIHDISEIEDELQHTYAGHHQYDWVRPRRTWLDALCPVYIDFGKDYLVRLEVYDSSELQCIRLVSKLKFIQDVMTEHNVNNIASRFISATKHD